MAGESKTAEVLRVRRYGAVNGRGLWTLYKRGVLRYFKFGIETLGGPVVSSLLFLAVFVLALSGRAEPVPGLDVAQFVAPGIVMFSLAHSAFETGAFPVLYDKLEGMIQDVLAAPLTPFEILLGYALAAATCGLVTGAFISLAMWMFVELSLVDLTAILGFASLAALFFGLLGTLVGLWSDKWEHYTAAETFLVLPLGLLSGTFFSINALPEFGQTLIAANPVFYAIDGFRSGFIGIAESSRLAGVIILLTLIAVLAFLLWRLIAAGYKIRS